MIDRRQVLGAAAGTVALLAAPAVMATPRKLTLPPEAWKMLTGWTDSVLRYSDLADEDFGARIDFSTFRTYADAIENIQLLQRKGLLDDFHCEEEFWAAGGRSCRVRSKLTQEGLWAGLTHDETGEPVLMRLPAPEVGGPTVTLVKSVVVWNHVTYERRFITEEGVGGLQSLDGIHRPDVKAINQYKRLVL